MKQAFHPFKNQPITVPEYVAEFGGRLKADGTPNIRPPARCPVCNGPMATRGEASPPVDRVFVHNPVSAIFCPLKESAEKPYLMLPEVNPNIEDAAALRASFFAHWKYHWAMMRHAEYSPFADIADFVTLIQYADAHGLWLYRHIKEWEIPYIFLALKDFPPIKSKGKTLRAEWIRFWFDSRVRTIADLWIRTEGDWRIVKATYSKPRNGLVPGAAQLNTVAYPTILKDFLQKPEPFVNAYQVNVMEKAFPSEIGII